MIKAVTGQWLSIGQIAEEIGEDRDIVKNKTGIMVANGLLKARVHCKTRRFTKGKGQKEKKVTRNEIVAKRREDVALVITKPIKKCWM